MQRHRILRIAWLHLCRRYRNKEQGAQRKDKKEDNILYISSGTWSLMGTELMEANCTPESKACNLTNEGGYDYRFRYLKNIMGLWMIQSVKKEIGEGYSFGECSIGS